MSEKFESVWAAIQKLPIGATSQNWSVDKGYLEGTFQITKVISDSVTVSAEKISRTR